MKRMFGFSCLLLTILGVGEAQAKPAKASCERVQIHAAPWLMASIVPMTVEAVRRNGEIFTSKDATDIESILGRLLAAMEATPVKDSSRDLDARLVVDCFKPEGQVETFVASIHELRHPPDKKAVAIDEKFRQFFTLDPGFAKRLKK